MKRIPDDIAGRIVMTYVRPMVDYLAGVRPKGSLDGVLPVTLHSQVRQACGTWRDLGAAPDVIHARVWATRDRLEIAAVARGRDRVEPLALALTRTPTGFAYDAVEFTYGRFMADTPTRAQLVAGGVAATTRDEPRTVRTPPRPPTRPR